MIGTARKTDEEIVTGKPPIGQLLMEKGLIVPQDLEFALEHQRRTREFIGEILIRMGAIDRDTLETALGTQIMHFLR